MALPGGRLCQGASCGPGFAGSLRLCGAGFNFSAAACVDEPPPLLPGVRWPFASVWRAGAVPSGVCSGLIRLGPRLASLAWCCGVLWCAVLRQVVLCVLRRVGPCLVVLRPAGPGRVAPCRAMVCRSVPRRVASCCGVLCFGVPCRVALHCGALRCGVPCCLVLCRGWSVKVRLVRVVVQSAGQSVAGWWLGAAVRLVVRWVRAVGVWVCRSGRWVG